MYRKAKLHTSQEVRIRKVKSVARKVFYTLKEMDRKAQQNVR